MFISSIGDANEWLKKNSPKNSDITTISNRTVKSFHQRIKVFENRFRYEEENFKLDQNDMFAVFGEDIGKEMLSSKIPTIHQIRAMQKRIE